jgi:hypothetical protein
MLFTDAVEPARIIAYSSAFVGAYGTNADDISYAALLQIIASVIVTLYPT